MENESGIQFSKTMSKKDYDNWQSSINTVEAKNAELVKKQYEELGILVDDILSEEELIEKVGFGKYYQTIQKNYNDTQKLLDLAGGTIEDIAFNTGGTFFKVGGMAIDLFTPTFENGKLTGTKLITEGDQSSIQKYTNQRFAFKNNLKKTENIYSQGYRIISYEDKDRSGLAELKFIGQEAATQAPLLATMTLPGGMWMLGGFSSGEQLGTLYQNDARVTELQDQLEKVLNYLANHLKGE